MKQINGKTAVLGIVGHPVSHSLSPAMHNAALSALGLDYVYVPFAVHPDRLPAAVAGMRALGVVGFNVTIPHKTAIIPWLDGLDESAAAAEAVNTVHNVNGRLIGYNTDGSGLVRSLDEDLGFYPCGATIVMIGAGGAARGALASFCRAGAGKVIIINRDTDKAHKLAEFTGNRYAGTEIAVAADAEQLRPYLGSADLLLNTTSLGMNQERIPFVNFIDLPDSTKVYDMVYSPPMTPFLTDATRRGLSAANGLGMLVGQAEAAFKIWTGVFPPSGVMRSAVSGLFAE